MKRSFFSALAVLLAAAGACAAPLRSSDVAADPAVVLHLDIDALLASPVGQTILSNADTQARLSAMTAAFNFDLRSQLHGLTVYTPTDQPTNGVMIVYAGFDSNRIVTIARGGLEGFKISDVGSQRIFSWLDEKHETNGVAPRVYAGIADNRVLFARSGPIISAALDVIAGKAPGFTDTQFLPQAMSLGEKTVLVAAIKPIALDTANPGAAVLKMAKVVRLWAGTSNDSVRLKLGIDAQDDNSAMQISQIVSGLLAMLRLNKNPALTKLADDISVKINGSSVSLSLAAPGAQILNLWQKPPAAAGAPVTP